MKTSLTILAVILCLLALAGFWGNFQFMMRGQGLPEQPDARQGFIIGMFAVPTLLVVAGVVCGILAARKVERSDGD